MDIRHKRHVLNSYSILDIMQDYKIHMDKYLERLDINHDTSSIFQLPLHSSLFHQAQLLLCYFLILVIEKIFFCQIHTFANF